MRAKKNAGPARGRRGETRAALSSQEFRRRECDSMGVYVGSAFSNHETANLGLEPGAWKNLKEAVCDIVATAIALRFSSAIALKTITLGATFVVLRRCTNGSLGAPRLGALNPERRWEVMQFMRAVEDHHFQAFVHCYRRAGLDERDPRGDLSPIETAADLADIASIPDEAIASLFAGNPAGDAGTAEFCDAVRARIRKTAAAGIGTTELLRNRIGAAALLVNMESLKSEFPVSMFSEWSAAHSLRRDEIGPLAKQFSTPLPSA
jgi:hypothetical protein